MKRRCFIALSVLATLTSQASIYEFTEGKYQLRYDDSAKEITVTCNGTELFKQAYAEAVYNILGNTTDVTISSKEIAASVEKKSANDEFGTGSSYQLAYNDGTVTMRQYFNFYNGREDYFICYNTIEANDGKTTLQSRRMIPLATETKTQPFNVASSSDVVNMIWVPFDNDGHGRYHNYKFSSMKESESISHEVSAAFYGQSRLGLVAGSVDHDKWKSGVQIYGQYNSLLSKFMLLSGLTNATTRDILPDGTIIPHGKVKGVTVSSARYMVGMFDDWREGLNTFGDCCTAVVPKAPWSKGNPVGWSTYGVMQERVNEQGVRDCCDFMTRNLRESGFYDADGKISISFDACANDNISDAKIRNLISSKLNKEDMVLGMYGGHMCIWPWALGSKIDGTGVGSEPEFVWRNAALRVNGDIFNMPSNGSIAVDPTHPGIKANVEKFMKKWAGWGVKYVKADFLNGGIIEGDSWYDPEITTGVMAYNYGMKLMYDIAEKYGIYIVEAMSPMFPYQYAHGRRTCCDRFSKIDETEYVMNSISYGWWTDRLYTVNDPDQLVLVGRNNKKSESIGENRARATSGMVSGAYIWGDNFSENCVHTSSDEASKQGVSVGDPVGWPTESRERALQIMNNRYINEYVRTHTGSFMPVNGDAPTSYLNGSNQQSENLFYRVDDNYCYVAAFSFSKYSNYNADLTWERLGINSSDVTAIKELWTDEDVSFDNNGFKVSVPKADARVYRVEFSWSAGNDEISIDNETASDNVTVTSSGNTIIVNAATPISEVNIYSVDGQLIGEKRNADTTSLSLGINSSKGVAIVRTILRSGKTETSKIML